MDAHDVGHALGQKLGPLPVWAWGAGGGVLLALVLKARGGGGGSSTSSATGPLSPAAQGDVTTADPNAAAGGGGGWPNAGNAGSFTDPNAALLPSDTLSPFDWTSLLETLATPAPVQVTAPITIQLPTAPATASSPALPSSPGAPALSATVKALAGDPNPVAPRNLAAFYATHPQLRPSAPSVVQTTFSDPQNAATPIVAAIATPAAPMFTTEQHVEAQNAIVTAARTGKVLAI